MAADVVPAPETPDPCFVVPFCPICRVGQMRMTYRTNRLAVCVCMNCETSLSVPETAWSRAASPPGPRDAGGLPQA